MDVGKEGDVSLSVSGVDPDSLQVAEVSGLTLRLASPSALSQTPPSY